MADARRSVAWTILVVVAAGCAAPAVVTPPRPAGPPPGLLGWEQQGRASWYGEPHHGRRTASGEVYDMHQLTAAHRTLPLGTRVVVTNLANERTVEVRINDRGPFVDGRILDLSYAAALALDGVRDGVMRVRLRVIGAPAGARAPAP